MSGHLRFCFAAFVLLAGLSASPASSNPFADLFNAAPAASPCARSRGRGVLAATRQVDGGRPALGLSSGRPPQMLVPGRRGDSGGKKRVRYRAAKPPVTAPEENEAARPKRKAVVDARAELLRSAPAETSQPTPPAPEFKVVDAASVPAMGTAAFVPPAPVENRATDQLTPDQRHAAPGRRGDASGGRTGRQRRGCRLRASGRAGHLSYRRGSR